MMHTRSKGYFGIFVVLSFLFITSVDAKTTAECQGAALGCGQAVEKLDCEGKTCTVKSMYDECTQEYNECFKNASDNPNKPAAAGEGADGGSGSGNDYGLKETADAAKLPNTDSNVASLVGKIIQAALSLVATIFFFLMVYGGFLWMTARGNTDQIGKAKDLITQAIVGVVVISAAWAITNFVISRIG
tara:strand:- start:1608 stop:2171 length:564 start_codon:yes stop_codon:yes gene_type:complete